MVHPPGHANDVIREIEKTQVEYNILKINQLLMGSSKLPYEVKT